MAENLIWLFAAFALGWLFIFAYLFWIANKERTLSQRVARLEELLKDRE